MSRTLSDQIRLALGEEPADLLFKEITVVNTLSGELHQADVAVSGSLFLGFGDYPAREVVDGRGLFLCPGLIDGHIHIESTLLNPVEFARSVAGRGTCAVVADPHEIANVLGLAGIEYMIAASANLPVDIFFTMPSCVPATPLETSGANISPQDISSMFSRHPDRILGLAEMMNFPGVVHGDPDVLAKLEAAGNRIIDGHAPLLSGRELNAYIMAGPSSDHESSQFTEAREKLRKGMFLMIREGTSAKNMEELLPLLNQANVFRMGFVSDDRHPTDLLVQGHMDHAVRKAVSLGVDPVRAVQMASLTTAQHFGLKDRGAIAPGYRADFLLLSDLERFTISEVYLQGRPVREIVWPVRETPILPGSMQVRRITEKDLQIRAQGKKMRVIGIIPGQIVTESRTFTPREEQGITLPDPGRDLAKIVVAERHHNTGRIGKGFVQGLGMRRGAVASTVAHDSHNLILAGMNDRDIVTAAEEVRRMGGGMATVLDGEVIARLPLSIAGLMSDQPLEEVVREFELLEQACPKLGPTVAGLFMHLSFLALPVIPSLKLTDRGLVDVNRFSFTSLWTE